MKPFMGIDLTVNRKNTQRNGTEFLIQKVSSTTLENLKKVDSSLETNVKKQLTPIWLLLTQFALFMLAMLGLAYILGRSSLSQGYRNIIFLVPILAIWWYTKRKEKRSENGLQEAYHTAASESIEPLFNMLSELEVPDHAVLVEILTFSYKKRGSVSVAKEIIPRDITNPAAWAFTDDRYLYLANSDGKFAFPLAQMTAIYPIHKKVNLFVPQVKRNLRRDELEATQELVQPVAYTTEKMYYVLAFMHNGEQWGIYFPSYELNAFQSLTGLSV